MAIYEASAVEEPTEPAEVTTGKKSDFFAPDAKEAGHKGYEFLDPRMEYISVPDAINFHKESNLAIPTAAGGILLVKKRDQDEVQPYAIAPLADGNAVAVPLAGLARGRGRPMPKGMSQKILVFGRSRRTFDDAGIAAENSDFGPMADMSIELISGYGGKSETTDLERESRSLLHIRNTSGTSVAFVRPEVRAGDENKRLAHGMNVGDVVAAYADAMGLVENNISALREKGNLDVGGYYKVSAGN